MVLKNYWQFVPFGQVIWFSIKSMSIGSQIENRLKVVMINVYSMKLTQLISKVFGFIKITSLVFIVGLGVYGLAIQKGDLSVWKPENRNCAY